MPTTSPNPPAYGSTSRTTRDDRFDEILDSYEIAEHAEEQEGRLRQFLLVEENQRNTPAYWATTWDSVADALAYHRDQEYAEDWMIDAVIDLDTGDEVPLTAGTSA